MFFRYNSAPNSNVSQGQRESENYIRKVEQNKIHHYNIEETWFSTKKEWQQKKEQIKKIQHDQTLPAAKQQLNKIKNLQNALEQSILKQEELLNQENETVTNEAFCNSNEIQAQKKKETIEKEKNVVQFDRLKKKQWKRKRNMIWIIWDKERKRLLILIRRLN